jgi:hypothetical protein
LNFKECDAEWGAGDLFTAGKDEHTARRALERLYAAGGVDVIFQGKGAVRNDATQQTEAMDLQMDRLEDLLLFWEHNLDEREDEMLMLKQHGSLCEQRNAVRKLASKLAPKRRELERAYERLATVRDATMVWILVQSLKEITERLATDCWESAGRIEKTLTAVPMAFERVAIDDTSSDQEIDGLEVDHKGDERVDVKQGVGLGFDKESAERYNVKMTGHENVEFVSVSRMNEEAGEGYKNRRVGRKGDERVVWFEPKAVRWRVEGLCARRVNWKSVRWRMAKRRVNWKLENVENDKRK